MVSAKTERVEQKAIPKKPSTVSISFTDVHFPYQNDTALEVVKKVIQTVKPDITTCLGDLLDCSQFSAHDPSFGIAETAFDQDIDQAKDLLDFVQKHTRQRTIVLLGNHEYRIERWAAKHKEGRAIYNMVAPHIQLGKTSTGDMRKKFTLVPYGSANGKYPHYKLNNRVVQIHGWSYAQGVTREHLRMSQGKSVLLGHCHRVQSQIIQNVWEDGDNIQCHSIGCLCKLVPLYGCGSPVDWVNAFCLGFHGRNSDSFYTIPIRKNKCILPDGKEIKI